MSFYETEEIQEYIKDIIKNDNIIDEPFYIVNLQDVRKNYNIWVELLPDIKPYFAIKSNSNVKIIETLAELGCNFDCASKNEITTVLNITNDPSRIIYANPCKFSSHIAFAKTNNVKLMTFDCIEELYKIKEYYPDAELLLRLRVDDTYSLCKFNYKFGCDLNNIDAVFQTVLSLNLNLVGFSFHVGSSCSNARSYYDAIKICNFAYIIALNHKICSIKIIDIGGGFSSIDMVFFNEICENIKRARLKFFKNINIDFIAEPGRFFTETSHTLVISVIAKKVEDCCIKYYINEGIYGSFNCINYDYKKPELKLLYPNNNNKIMSVFFGPTCDSIDIINKGDLFPELNIGDFLYIKNFGAYTISPSSNFNGFCVKDYKYLDF